MKVRRSSLIALLALGGCAFSTALTPEASARSRVEVTTSIGYALPRGAVHVMIHDEPYYLHRDVYYRRAHHGYIVTRAPVGAVVRSLPRGYVRIDYRGQPYYRCDDVYYRPSRHGYVVVEAPAYVRRAAGVLEEAPQLDAYASYRAVWVNQRELLIKDGQFFRKTPEGLAWVEPPIGGLAAKLPQGAISVWFQEEEFFESGGAYFRKTPSGFKVVQSPWSSSEGDEEPEA